MPLLIGANLLAHKASYIGFSNYWSLLCHIVKGNIRVSVSFHYFGIDWSLVSSFVNYSSHAKPLVTLLATGLYQIYTCNIGIYLLFSGPRPYLASGILSKGQVFHAQTAIFYWINSATSLIYWPTRPLYWSRR